MSIYNIFPLIISTYTTYIIHIIYLHISILFIYIKGMNPAIHNKPDKAREHSSTWNTIHIGRKKQIISR